MESSAWCSRTSALAVILYAQRHGTRRPWLVQLLGRRTAKVAAVALANKMARMIWGDHDERRTLQRTIACSR
ncbi:hypothetical protein BQ8482_111626 [Mesorhizobium delmotii]|uniref:Transposase n=1 Tax=Mesorhizobium delmotii TaxID=1631247 RepID=A0A2P9AF04_9HYPH|nr:hypothetical protein BQ8482_111626 [Mesorhizobium delmotii]